MRASLGLLTGSAGRRGALAISCGVFGCLLRVIIRVFACGCAGRNWKSVEGAMSCLLVVLEKNIISYGERSVIAG